MNACVTVKEEVYLHLYLCGLTLTNSFVFYHFGFLLCVYVVIAKSLLYVETIEGGGHIRGLGIIK